MTQTQALARNGAGSDDDLAARLQEPFDPALVEFRPQGSLNQENRGRAIAYVDARAVAARLDAIFGPLGWSFTWESIIQDNAIRIVRGVITVGDVVKSDVGEGEKTEPSKAAVSDALKRTAVLLGIGRYLYALDVEWVEGKPAGNSWVIPDKELARLRSKLPRPAGTAPFRAVGHQPDQRPAVPDAAAPVPATAQVREATATAPVSSPRQPPPGGVPNGTFTQAPETDSLQDAWIDFRYVAAMAGYDTDDLQKGALQELYPGCKPKQLTVAEVRRAAARMRERLDLLAHDGAEPEAAEAI